MCVVDMKKVGLFVFALLFVSMTASLVSAGAVEEAIETVNNAGKVVYGVVKPVLEIIIGKADSGEFFLAKILFLVIIFAIIWKAASRVPFFSENDWVLWIVSIGVSILAIRWFGNVQIIKTVILPYSVLGIVISVAIPFVLAFFIIKDFGKTMRKVSWILFAVIFVGLWASRYEEIKPFGYIYLAVAGLSLLMMLFDGTIAGLKTKAEMDKVGKDNKDDAIVALKKKITDLPNLVRDGAIDSTEADKLKKRYQKKILWISKH